MGKKSWFNSSFAGGAAAGIAVTMVMFLLVANGGEQEAPKSAANVVKPGVKGDSRQNGADLAHLPTCKAPIHKRRAEMSRLLFTDPRCQDKQKYLEHRRDAVVVEVGSYHGEEIVQFRGRVKRLYSFEPHPAKIQKIEDTIKVEGMTGIATIKNAAVTNFSGSITMYLPNGPESQQDSIGKINFNTNEVLKSIVVPAVTLDDEIKEHVDLLKIDTQGHEYNVLLGAKKLIENYGVDIIHAEYSPELMKAGGVDKPWEMLQFLYDSGYVCFYCTEPFTDGQLPKFSTDPTWAFENFTNNFGVFMYGGVNHGMWGDIVCI